MEQKEMWDTRSDQSETEQHTSDYPAWLRILAALGALLFLLLLAALLFTAFTGGSTETLLMLLFCLIVIPCILYGFRMYVRITVKRRKR